MAGFASLMVAHRRGIFGLGLLLTVGMIATLIASLAVLPVLLRMFYGPTALDASPTSEGVSGETAEPARSLHRMTVLSSKGGRQPLPRHSP